MFILQKFSPSFKFLEFFFSFSFFFNFFFLFILFNFYTYLYTIKNINNIEENNILLLFFKNILKKFFIFSFLFILISFYFFLNICLVNTQKYNTEFVFKSLLDGYVLNFKTYQFYINIYGFLILFISYFAGFIAVSTLNTVYTEQRVRLYIIFLQFLIVIYGFVQTNDLLLLFFFYEVLLLGSFLVVYYSSYVKKAVQASLYFVIWTQLGSILVLLAVCYIYNLTNSTNFFLIKYFPFKKNEAYIIYTLLFFGFGFKLPIWPFHYWLTKVHVEAPSGFSIYLSGFLVKTALYGFYKITNLIHVELNTSFFFVIALIGTIDASLKMWGQTDLKKLIAYCTIQEMNLIVLFFLQGDSNILFFGILFNITHTFLSTLMFYLIECIYIRYHARSIFLVKGIFYSCTNLSTMIIFMIIFFSGIPGTLKFICEFYLLTVLLNFSWILCFFIIFIVNVFGLIGFCKNWFNALFTMPNIKKKNIILDLSKKELYICLLCFFNLMFFTYVPFILI